MTGEELDKTVEIIWPHKSALCIARHTKVKYGYVLQSVHRAMQKRLSTTNSATANHLRYFKLRASAEVKFNQIRNPWLKSQDD